jgi:hypothetical protein
MIIPVGFAQVNLKFTGVPHPTGAEVTFGVGGGAGALSATEIADAVADAVSSSGIMANFDSNSTITSIGVKKGPNSNGPYGEVLTNIPGSVTSTAQPPNTALLVTKNTNLGGRQGRGRLYWPALGANQVLEGGQINPSTAVAMQADFDSFFGKLQVANLPLTLLHADTLVPTTITSLTVQGRAATQRRRLRR